MAGTRIPWNSVRGYRIVTDAVWFTSITPGNPFSMALTKLTFPSQAAWMNGDSGSTFIWGPLGPSSLRLSIDIWDVTSHISMVLDSCRWTSSSLIPRSRFFSYQFQNETGPVWREQGSAKCWMWQKRTMQLENWLKSCPGEDFRGSAL